MTRIARDTHDCEFWFEKTKDVSKFESCKDSGVKEKRLKSAAAQKTKDLQLRVQLEIWWMKRKRQNKCRI